MTKRKLHTPIRARSPVIQQLGLPHSNPRVHCPIVDQGSIHHGWYVEGVIRYSNCNCLCARAAHFSLSDPSNFFLYPDYSYSRAIVTWLVEKAENFLKKHMTEYGIRQHGSLTCKSGSSTCGLTADLLEPDKSVRTRLENMRWQHKAHLDRPDPAGSSGPHGAHEFAAEPSGEYPIAGPGGGPRSSE